MTNLTSHRSAKNDPANVPIYNYLASYSDDGSDLNAPASEDRVAMCGIRLPHDQSPKDLKGLDHLLEVDVQASSDTYINNVAGLISEQKGVFPDSKLPIIPSHDLLCQLSLYDTQQEKWRIPDISRSKGLKENPNISSSEEKLAEFLNSVCNCIEEATGKKPVRQWNAAFCNTVLEGSPSLQKPDIALVDVDKQTPVVWPSIRAITEVTTQNYETRSISDTVTDKTYMILTTQPNRTFVPILSIWGNFNFRLTVTDRQGQLRSQVLDLGNSWRIHDSVTFLRLMIGFCFADKPVVGYDPTMLMDDRDRVTSIMCAASGSQSSEPSSRPNPLLGVWEVEYERKKKYILKDAWVESSRSTSEYVLLARLQGMEGVPQLFCGCDISINNVLLTTGLIRYGLCGDQTGSRVWQRVVSSTIGDHIVSFSSKKELISAFRDIVIRCSISLPLCGYLSIHVRDC